MKMTAGPNAFPRSGQAPFAATDVLTNLEPRGECATCGCMSRHDKPTFSYGPHEICRGASCEYGKAHTFRTVAIAVLAVTFMVVALAALLNLSATVRAADVVDFTYVVQGDGATVSFEDVSTTNNGTTVSRTWDFGDGTNLTTTGATASHRYAQVGRTYTVRLEVAFNRTDNATARVSTSKDVALPPVKAGVCGLAIGVPLALVGLAKMARYRGKSKDRVRPYGSRRRKDKRRRWR